MAAHQPAAACMPSQSRLDVVEHPDLMHVLLRGFCLAIAASCAQSCDMAALSCPSHALQLAVLCCLRKGPACLSSTQPLSATGAMTAGQWMSRQVASALFVLESGIACPAVALCCPQVVRFRLCHCLGSAAAQTGLGVAVHAVLPWGAAWLPAVTPCGSICSSHPTNVSLPSCLACTPCRTAATWTLWGPHSTTTKQA